MKRKTCFAAIAAWFVSVKTFAQSSSNMFGDSVQNFQNEIEGYFPLIVGIVFIISALFNMGKFFGEDRDIKKGVTNILIYVGATLIVMGAYKFLAGQSI